MPEGRRHGSDARSVSQPTFGLCDQCGHGFGVVLQLHIPGPDLGDQAGGEGVAGELGRTLLGRTGNPTRFPTAGAFAQYAGTAPIEIASA
ncbi:transposase, partial [Streptomyces sp. NPDC002205]|uniref:transposase n=1 Tax=Streptomyces sp. NPDC002205 TaxID=3154411 RepID=UPI0033168738